MKNVNIYEKKYLDLIFENKNKEYGAYILRLEVKKTTLKAFLSSVAIIVSILTIFVFFTSFGDKPEEITIITIKPVSSDIFDARTAKPKSEKKKEISTKPNDIKTSKTLPIQIVQTDQADNNVPHNNEIPKVNSKVTTNGSENSTLLPTTENIVNETETEPKISNNGIENTTSLDKQPLFPGGIERFYAYVGQTFEKPELNESNTVRILVSFVIERDGAMTSIKVISKTNEELNQEAIRVLKSLKTKWTAGIKDGQAVRTQYTLPIVIVSE